MTDLVIRPLTVGEEHVFDLLAVPALVGPAAFGRSYRRRAETHEYRPEWTWMAVAGDAVVARAAWWGGPADDEPVVLDWFDFTDAEAGTAVLRAAPLRCEYGLQLPPGWRDRPPVRAAAQARIDAATAAGTRPLVERYNYRWTADRGLPPRPGRLIFRPDPDDGGDPRPAAPSPPRHPRRARPAHHRRPRRGRRRP